MSDAIAAHLLTHFLLSLVENTCGRRNWQPETRREGEMAGVSSCLSSICKKSKFPTGDMIVIKTNKKRTDECINQNTAEHRWWAAVCGVGPKERGGGLSQLHTQAPLYEICMSFSSWQRGHTRLRKIHCSTAHWCRWPVLVADRPIINEMHANIIACGHGETFGTAST